jgi:hypothetical protein
VGSYNSRGGDFCGHFILVCRIDSQDCVRLSGVIHGAFCINN